MSLSLLLMVLVSITSILPACQTGRSAMDLADLIPETLGTWTLSVDYPDIAYDHETIFDYMNGAGEVFLSFDYRGMLVRRFEQPDQELTIEVYDMGNPADAFGIFARSRSGPDIGIGQGSQQWAGQVNFWKDRFYVSVYTLLETEESNRDVQELAGIIANNIAGEGELPEIFTMLPPEELVGETVRYFHLHTDLNRWYFIADENILDLDPATEAIMANYESDEEYRYLLVVRYPDSNRAGEVFSRFHDIYLPEAESSGAVEIEDGLWSAADVSGAYIFAVFDAQSTGSARALLAAVKARIEGAEQ